MLSEATVTTHVAWILGLRDRIQAAMFAYRHRSAMNRRVCQRSAHRCTGRSPIRGRALVLVALSLLLAGCGGGGGLQISSTPTVPSDYLPYFEVAAKRCPGVLTPAGLAGQAYVESHFRPDAVSSSGAQGLMQLTAANFARYGTDANGDGRADPFTPADSIATGAKFNCSLAMGLRNVAGSPTELRLAAYNAGINAVRKYGTIPPYPETQNYVQQVQEWTRQFASAFPAGTGGGP